MRTRVGNLVWDIHVLRYVFFCPGGGENLDNPYFFNQVDKFKKKIPLGKWENQHRCKNDRVSGEMDKYCTLENNNR